VLRITIRMLRTPAAALISWNHPTSQLAAEFLPERQNWARTAAKKPPHARVQV